MSEHSGSWQEGFDDGYAWYVDAKEMGPLEQAAGFGTPNKPCRSDDEEYNAQQEKLMKIGTQLRELCQPRQSMPVTVVFHRAIMSWARVLRIQAGAAPSDLATPPPGLPAGAALGW